MKTLGREVALRYLRDQVDDYCGWFVYLLRDHDHRKMKPRELAAVGFEALIRVLTTGSPPHE